MITRRWRAVCLLAVSATSVTVALHTGTAALFAVGMLLGAIGLVLLMPDPDRADPLHEWRCPNCGATTRARMADHPNRRRTAAGDADLEQRQRLLDLTTALFGEPHPDPDPTKDDDDPCP